MARRNQSFKFRGRLVDELNKRGLLEKVIRLWRKTIPISFMLVACPILCWSVICSVTSYEAKALKSAGVFQTIAIILTLYAGIKTLFF